MTSYAKFDVWQDTQGNKQNTVVQVVKSVLGEDLGTTSSDQTNNFPAWVITTNTSTWTDTNNLQLSITPKFANSLIRLDLCFHNGTRGNANSAAVRVIRGDKIVFRPMSNATVGPFSMNFHGSTGTHTMQSFVFYDTPNTTNTVTYSLQYRAYTTGSSVDILDMVQQAILLHRILFPLRR